MIEDAPSPGSEERPSGPSPGSSAEHSASRRFGGLDLFPDNPIDNPDEPDDLPAALRHAEPDAVPSDAPRDALPASAPGAKDDIAIPDIPEGAVSRRQSGAPRPPAGWRLGSEAFHPFAATPPPASTVMPPRLGPGGVVPTWPAYAPLAGQVAGWTGGFLSSLVSGLAGGLVQGLHRGWDAARSGGNLGGAVGERLADALSASAWEGHRRADGGAATDPDVLAARLFEADRSLREAAGSEAMASLLGRAREHARRLGIPEGSALWEHLHDAALGRNLDPEARTLAASLADAIERSGAGETLREMAETRAALEATCLERLRTLAGRGREAQPELDRLQALLGRLEKLDPPFEKPGEETGATRIAETARRLAQMVRRLVDGLFGRKPVASDFSGPDEEAPPPPAP